VLAIYFRAGYHSGGMGKEKSGLARAAKLSSERRREIASMGGKARSAAMTPRQRKKAALKAIRARWAGKKAA
jgi:hypothetical protein